MGGAVAFPSLGFTGSVTLPLLFFPEGLLASGGVNEESGWRGFVLPRLQARHPVLVATLIVWWLWALRRLPLDIGTRTPIQQVLLKRLFFNFVVALLLAMVYKRMTGRLLAPALLHALVKTAGRFLRLTLPAILLIGVAGIGAVLGGQTWNRIPAASDTVCSAPALRRG